MGVVSNFFLPGMPQALLEHFGLDGYFEFIIDSAQVGLKKPHPDIFIAALDRAGLLPHEAQRVVYIGDSLQNDYYAPRSAGLASVFFDRSRDRPSQPAGADIEHIKLWEDFDGWLASAR